MKLYTVPLAPNPTKVMLYLAERATKGCALEIQHEVVNTLKGRHKEPAHLARTPFGTLPVLELDDGTFLRESLSIIGYLEDKFPEHALAPDTPEARAAAADIERIVELRIANPLGHYVHVKKSPVGYPPDPKRAAEIEASLETPLDFVENLLADDRPYLTGDSPAVADCTLASALQFLRYIEVDLMGDRPKLRAWDERYRGRPELSSILRW